MSEEFELALQSYGQWRPHPRFGRVWVPTGMGRNWRPYENGHWVYTDEWGWYWVSEEAEEDFGWVTYHYGRWVHDRGAWFWVPGEEWAPAWVDWRYSDEYIGWAPLPPDEMIGAYEAEPNYWMFVPGRYMTSPRLRTYYLPQQRRVLALRSTRIVNRTVAVQGQRIAVNPGISPNFVARVTRAALPTYRVQPRVFGRTQGVSGAVQVRREDLGGGRGQRGQGGQRGQARVNAVAVQRTTTVIQPATAATPAPQALGKDERGGRLGTRPPRAAQSGGATPPPASPPVTPPVGTAPRSGAAPTTPTPPPPAPPRVATPPGTTPTPAPPVQPRIATPPAVNPATPAPPPGGAAPPPRPNGPRSGPREDRRDPSARPGEPPVQAKPVRPVTPQTPPPPPPAQSAPRQAPAPPAPPVVRPAPVAPPPPPVARPAPPPPPPPVARPAPPPPPPPPPVAKPAAPPPPPPAAAKPAVPPKPGEKPEEKK